MISAALGFAAGIGITLLLQRRRLVLKARRGVEERSLALNAPQLLAWIDAATQGWMILAPDHSIAYINGRAERLLHISSNRLVRGMKFLDVMDIPSLEEVIFSSRHQQRLQRCEWDQQGDPLEAVVLPGSDECLLVLIQSRQSLEAQQQQQERWVSDVAHELKTPLTALMLVSDRLELAVSAEDTALCKGCRRNSGVFSCWWKTCWSYRGWRTACLTTTATMCS